MKSSRPMPWEIWSAATKLHGAHARGEEIRVDIDRMMDAREGQDRMGDEEYVEADGQDCPFCGADGTQRAFDNVEIDGQLATQKSHCLECGKVVTDYYQLIGYKAEDES